MNGSEYGAAVAAVGTFEPSVDWKIEPESHADSLPPEAAPLARILRKPVMTDLMEDFRRQDVAAVKAQKTYKRYGRLAIMLNTLAVLVGALALLSGHVLPALDARLNIFPDEGARLIAIGQLVAVGGAILAAQLIIRLRPFDKWMKSRAEAENTRLALFETVIGMDEDIRDGELPLLPLQFEYFRRYQLETQRDYYTGRGAQHERAATTRETRGEIFSLIAAFAAAPASVFFLALVGGDPMIGLPQVLENLEASLKENPYINEGLYFTGIVASALLSMQTALSLLSQDRRNASRYKMVGSNLDYLYKSYLAKARAAAAAGDREAVLEFISTVNSQISSEHMEWIALQNSSPRPDFETIATSKLPTLSSKYVAELQRQAKVPHMTRPVLGALESRHTPSPNSLADWAKK